jgi:CRISPR-associated endonuclease Csn1
MFYRWANCEEIIKKTRDMKKILGLDLGTNSIGWALVKQDFENKQGEILGLGSRIIPMSQDIIGEFGKGNSVSQTAERTGYRGVRRLRERHLLRRERLHRVLNVLDFLPSHYANQIDFVKKLGKFIGESEPKLVYDNKEFIFKDSFEEMLNEFKENQPLLLGNDNKVPYDWTIYYLRKKALTQKISKHELAWIILNFNQKRGYYQLRGEEEEENPNKSVEFYSLQIVDVIPDDEANKKGELWYSLHLENGWIYRRSSKVSLEEWKYKTRDFIVTTDLNDDGTIKLDKDGAEKRSFRAPKEDDWGLVKKKTEQEIEQTKKTVGEYIYQTLLQNPKQKIKGKLVRTIERKFYKEELELILSKQIELQPNLFTEEAYSNCVRELYRNNEAHQLSLSKKDFVHLFVNDIIFYQRPLRSQKSSIGNCALEYRTYKVDGVEQREYLKGVPKSNPYYQEFRVWQWLTNLKFYKNDDDSDVTSQFIKNEDDFGNLFDFLINQKEVDHKDIFKFFFKELKGKALNVEIAKYRWNYVYEPEKGESKKYPMNETRYEISKRLNKIDNLSPDFLTSDLEYKIWHIIYSVTDKKEYEKALSTFAIKCNIDVETFVDSFKKHPPYKSEYGSFSEKAIRKLLPLMRTGIYWNWEDIDVKTKSRIDNIINGVDDDIKIIVREKAEKHLLDQETSFQGLPLWLAQYVVYDRHSEAENAGKWNTVLDLESYLKDFKQHSLRNPIVEQIITETLRVVKDIWQKYGKGVQNYFDEIHVELGRDMKNTAVERKRLSSIVTDNENTNLRIKALLIELLNDNQVENVRPYSPMQQEILKIYEDGVLNSGIEISEDILKISKKSEPTKSELQRYKLWLEQKYRSPYTGQIIPLNKLFTTDYEIEHVIPQSRFFDDSFSNKVICESAVNKLKDNQVGLEFIKNHFGQKVDTGFGKVVTIFTEEQYVDFVKEHYAKNRSKRNKLLLEDVPETMVNRQLNDTRYISKYVTQVLSNLVRQDKDDDGVNAKNIIPGNGTITTVLKQDWGLNDVWNDLVLPRFERMNQITNSELFTTYNTKYQKLLPTVPFEYSKGFKKKRIDHRHHAMDALAVACATRDHVNLLNNQSAKSETKRYDLQRKLRNLVEVEYVDGKTGKQIKREIPKDFVKPWKTFTEDSRIALETIVVSFKQNLRVINKATNKSERWVEKNGVKKKESVVQEGLNWAIRKSMHKETVSGKINLPRIKVPKDKILTATRKSIDSSFNLKTIESITDTGIQKILKNYLLSKDGNSELAFSPEGLEDLNKNIQQFNDGKPHQPINKVRIFEVGSKFALGQFGNKKDKYVEAAKGTNLFFAIYQDEKGKRNYATIPLNEVIERQKQGLNSVPEINDKGDKLLFSLSPNDLVYVPMEGEAIHSVDFNNLTKDQTERIYKVEKFSGVECYFIRNDIAFLIKQYDAKSKVGELESQNKLQTTMTTDRIKISEYCIKLTFNRLGVVSLF